VRSRKLLRAVGIAVGLVVAGVGLTSSAHAAGTARLAGTTGTSTQAASTNPGAAFASDIHEIKNVGSSLCLQPVDSSFRAPIVQKGCSDDPLQGWVSLDMGSNHYRFFNAGSGFCLWVDDPLFLGRKVVQDECAAPGGPTVSNAEWTASLPLPNVVTLRSRVHFVDNNFCLDVTNGSPDPGAAIQVWRCNGGLAQRWVVGFN
jgi:hypothetical protein